MIGAPLDIETDDQAVAVEGVDVAYPLRDGGGIVGDGGVNDVVEEDDIVVAGGWPPVKAVKLHHVQYGLLQYAGCAQRYVGQINLGLNLMNKSGPQIILEICKLNL